MKAKPKTFREALDELERLAGDAGPDLRGKIETELHDLKEKFSSANFEDGKKKIEKQITERPWVTLGVIGVVFFILGWLVSNRRRD